MGMKKLLFILLILGFIVIKAQPPKSKVEYEKYIDSLYQINIKIAMDYGKILETNPDAIHPEPAIWFNDMDGNVYDYPPIRESDSIMIEREIYKRKLDSLNGKQFVEIEKYYNEKHKK